MMFSISIRRTLFTHQGLLCVAAWCSVLVCWTTAIAVEIEAFSEPYLVVDVSSPEVGVINQTLVREGDEVSQMQWLSQLDDRVLQKSLELARTAKDATGSRMAAESEVKVRQNQLEGYRKLSKQGNASDRELQRSEADFHQATARLQSVEEELEVRRLEYERVRAQIRQRRIESPIDGVVVAIRKEVGEFVSPNDPVIMRVVQLKSLKAVFSVPFPVAKDLKAGQQVVLRYGANDEQCDATIEFVSPIADPESASVSVKVRIANDERLIPSGVVCRWDLNVADVPMRSANAESESPRH
ncbi:efflux RND transporter periplasmic adaptor subunit [Rubripirellula reticaptiva]|uniref:Macrolide transporter subunit MacA n=1 Tax=Rubripirellula reticaptiva TaxID=2528013 RepID=A0A5C6EL82_9BACT|nr:efflux RND transporter periplasmic adaptor subunit [Rubripirellula reticaptiva]TWU49214.1 macrolide transporter subunit MacA [Rubripirellula reticaptiva]